MKYAVRVFEDDRQNTIRLLDDGRWTMTDSRGKKHRERIGSGLALDMDEFERLMRIFNYTEREVCGG